MSLAKRQLLAHGHGRVIRCLSKSGERLERERRFRPDAWQALELLSALSWDVSGQTSSFRARPWPRESLRMQRWRTSRAGVPVQARRLPGVGAAVGHFRRTSRAKRQLLAHGHGRVIRRVSKSGARLERERRFRPDAWQASELLERSFLGCLGPNTIFWRTAMAVRFVT
jgi:hypothetical protein